MHESLAATDTVGVAPGPAAVRRGARLVAASAEDGVRVEGSRALQFHTIHHLAEGGLHRPERAVCYWHLRPGFVRATVGTAQKAQGGGAENRCYKMQQSGRGGEVPRVVHQRLGEEQSAADSRGAEKD